MPILWQTNRIRRVMKNAMAAETLIQVECTEACFWISKLFNEMVFPEPDCHQTPIICHTDSHQLYVATMSLRPIKDYRLRSEMGVLR